jgi:hypothetical protein
VRVALPDGWTESERSVAVRVAVPTVSEDVIVAV